MEDIHIGQELNIKKEKLINRDQKFSKLSKEITVAAN